jgi:hypothetical protein
MEPDAAIGGNFIDIVKSPNAKDLEARLFEMTHDQVHIRVALEEWDPIRVAASKVVCMTVDDESQTIMAWNCRRLVSV